MIKKKLIDLKESILENFKCQKSGKCCTCSGNVYVTQNDKLNMSKELNISLIKFQQQYIHVNNGWECVSTDRFRTRCFLNKTNHCMVYKSRPNACKTYPNWDIIWELDANLKNEINSCPGLKSAVKKTLKLNKI
tara:strand:- start:794 stop:1195 length:402 start_codon:yes stop_codon:yes gene_type:complete